ncbi:MAG: non-heme iron oxygenase ferredoxin subunit [Proteobacteria bacterium]|nr:non-heme iron oxygenase ferredoxin subunit [Pseudomonadota bacterium]
MAEDWHKVARRSELAEGEIASATVGDKQVAIYLIDGEVHATDNICTHAFACLSDGYLENGIIECPLHAGRFEVKTGKALGAPVNVDIAVYAVKLVGDDVLVKLG